MNGVRVAYVTKAYIRSEVGRTADVGRWWSSSHEWHRFLLCLHVNCKYVDVNFMKFMFCNRLILPQPDHYMHGVNSTCIFVGKNAHRMHDVCHLHPACTCIPPAMSIGNGAQCRSINSRVYFYEKYDTQRYCRPVYHLYPLLYCRIA